MAGASQLVDGLLGLAGDYLRGGLRVSVKTNYTPEIPVAGVALERGGSSSSSAGRSLLGELLGVKAAVIVRNAQGAVVTTIGEPPATSAWRAALALGLLAGVCFLLVRGALK